MFPLNKEFITPDELEAQADSLERSAKRFEEPSLISALLGRAKAKRAYASRLREQAQDLRESADYLREMRSVSTSTTYAPHGVEA